MISEIRKMIKRGESERLELRGTRTHVETLARSICGMLNQQGGAIVVGVDDRGEVIGVNDAKSWVRELLAFVTAQLNPAPLFSASIHKLDDTEVVMIDVPQGADKPYSLSRSIYVRVGQSTFKADPATAAEMVEVQATLPGRWEQDAVPGFVISDCDGRELMEARNELKRIGRLGSDVTEDDEELPRRLRLVRNGQYINAAVLLFASDPLTWSPNLAVRVVSYASCQLSERQSAFLAATKPGHAYKTSHYAEITGVVARQAQREIGELLEWGFFERQGKGPAIVYARTEKAP